MASLDEIARLLKEVNESIAALAAKQKLSPNQVTIVAGLSDISTRLGLVQAGEFRVGNSLDPGFGFTGGRFGYPGFLYGSNTYFLAGVDNDVLQVGLSLADGKIYAGGGVVVLDADGIVIIVGAVATDENSYLFKTDGGTVTGGVYGSNSGYSTHNSLVAKGGTIYNTAEVNALGPYAEVRLASNSTSDALPAIFLKVIAVSGGGYVSIENAEYLRLPARAVESSTITEGQIYFNTSQHALKLAGQTVWERISNQPFGSFYGLDIAQTQAAAQNTWYLVSSTSIVTGKLNIITMNDPVTGLLTVPVAGKYLITWDMTISGSAASKHIRGAIAVNGTAVSDGQSHKETTGTTEFNIGGTAILSIALNDTLQLAFETIDAGTPTIEVHDVSFSAVRIGE